MQKASLPGVIPQKCFLCSRAAGFLGIKEDRKFLVGKDRFFVEEFLQFHCHGITHSAVRCPSSMAGSNPRFELTITSDTLKNIMYNDSYCQVNFSRLLGQIALWSGDT